MATKRTAYETQLDYLTTAVDRGEVHPDDADAIRELCAAYDAEDTTASLPKNLYDDRKDGHKAPGTLDGWAERLKVAAKGLHLTADDTDADAVNAWATGRVKADDGPGKSRVRDIENALKKFYRYHADLGVDPADITVHERDSASTWTARDLLDAEERRALRTVADHPRDLAIYVLLLYCGMRNTALRTMRVRDVDLDAAEWYFNRHADGLKGIDRVEEPRPLNQAFRAVREWLDFHPTGDPDHYLITGKPGSSKLDPTEPVTRETVRYTMAQLKEETATREDVVNVTKPCHPHFMRHNFVSMCLRHPDIKDHDIKFWLGHAPGSDVMESTYGHLSGDDHNQSGHNAFGISPVRGNGDEVDPWDMTCDTCFRVLSPGEDTCPECETARGVTPWSAANAEGGIDTHGFDPEFVDAILTQAADMVDTASVNDADEKFPGMNVSYAPRSKESEVPDEYADHYLTDDPRDDDAVDDDE